ncbi:3-beta hydroxysteroid dehydrogenase/isomerasefamily protein [Striga asiatica]|uniref:Reticulon-like protein n=1 Tax=Striga asiatica TaxID=4170 RepID=A0A5A7PK93_STRAF|nr:3-beta hydroxysteroid dehydrogenase/isomerasefamily protein [Striga asiatica]
MANENDGDGDLDREIKTCAVLGGRGFIGRTLVERLLKLGSWIVRVVDTAMAPDLEPSESLLSDALFAGRAVYFQVDVRDESQIVEAVKGVSAVFYTESMDSFPPDFYLCYNIIVQGAKNVVNACRECKVKRLIYNSSADVVFDNAHDICLGNESMPYSGQFRDMVTDLRTQAEALILFSNNVDGLLTCALRPCNVFGPGDKHFLPLLVNVAKSSWAKFIIGSGNNLSDFTYVENVAYAHICAEESLSSQLATVSGKVFFITDLEPMKFWEFASVLLEGLGYLRPVISLPVWVVHRIVYLITLLHVKSESRKLDLCASIYIIASLASRTRTFSCSAAQNHIQYSPVVSMEKERSSAIYMVVQLPPYKRSAGPLAPLNQYRFNGFCGFKPVQAVLIRTLLCGQGPVIPFCCVLNPLLDYYMTAPEWYKQGRIVCMLNKLMKEVYVLRWMYCLTQEAVKLTVESFSHLTVDSSFTRYKDSNVPSKVEKLLGSGEVADILLWRDERKTFLSFLVLALLYYWFFLSGGAFISSVAQLLLLITVSLCGHHILLLIGYGSRVPRLSSSCFEISEADMRNSFFTMKCMVDKIDYLIKSLAQGEDWFLFLKVSMFLYLCKVIIPHYLTTAIGLALILSFTLCYVYEQYEEKIDGIARVAYNIGFPCSISRFRFWILNFEALDFGSSILIALLGSWRRVAMEEDIVSLGWGFMRFFGF